MTSITLASEVVLILAVQTVLMTTLVFLPYSYSFVQYFLAYGLERIDGNGTSDLIA